MNRSMCFNLLGTFEFIVMFMSVALEYTTNVMNGVQLFPDEVEERVRIIMHLLTWYIPLAFACGCCDALQIKRWQKLLLIGVVLCLYIGDTIRDIHYPEQWVQEDVCIWFNCAKLQNVHHSSIIQNVLFLSRLFFAYASGREFAFLRPRSKMKHLQTDAAATNTLARFNAWVVPAETIGEVTRSTLT